MIDAVSASDKAHQSEMRACSYNLSEAIFLARKGIDPQTSKRPYKLPPAGNERGVSDSKNAQRAAKRRAYNKLPQAERMMMMHSEGATFKEIARAFRMSHQKVTSMIEHRRKMEKAK